MMISANKLTFKALVPALIFLAGCEPDEKINSLVVSPQKIEFQKDGGTDSITIQTDAASWAISYDAADWLELSNRNGTGENTTVTLNINTRTLVPRSDTLIIYAGNAKPAMVTFTQQSSEHLYDLTSDQSSLHFSQGGNAVNLNISTSSPSWELSSDVAWLEFSKVSGNQTSNDITVTASENTGSGQRTATITITADYAPSIQIPVTQSGDIYPSYNISPKEADISGMESKATGLAAKIKLGWNLGNTLEATGGETAWGNPLVTKAFIDFVKQSGFNAVRIPCSWNQYMANSTTAQLKTDWLNRVKEVVQYCVDNEMYALLNIHWDGGWLENNCVPEKQEANNAKQKAFWEQIATHMRDFDEHLLFASANEPNVENATQMAVLKSYHQTFIDAVRSTGGKNSYRVLVVQGASTDIEKTNKLMTSLPVDKVPDRLMVEVHYYTPWNFCGMTKDETWGNMFYYWGKDYHSATDVSRNPDWGEEATVDANFKLMKNQFVDKGVPVILGEYGVVRRSNLTGDALALHLASRAYYFKYVTKQALANGILPFYWDNGGTGIYGGGLFNRNSNTVFDQQALDSLVQGATGF